MKEKKILEVAKYIIENKATIELTAEHFNMSTSSIKKYINDKNNLQSIDTEIYNEVKRIQQELIRIGNQVGGKNGNGILKSKHTDFEAMEIAEIMVEEGLTIKEASNKFNIPKSTLYDMITKLNDQIIKDKLQMLFNINDQKFGNGSKLK